MRAGLALPHYGFSEAGEDLSWPRLAAAAQRAERLGFDSVWISDHFFLSLGRYGAADEPFGAAEPLTTLAGLAAITERVRLGTLVLCTTFRHPALVAKAASVIDQVSGGRLDLGLGAGWYEQEHRAFGYDFPPVGERFGILEETLEVLGLLFADGPASFEGEHFTLREAWNNPRPVRSPRPPLLVGGKGGPRMLRLVARHADGWNTVWAWTPEDYAERARALDAACEREGRDPATVRRSLGLYTLVGEDDADVADRHRRLLEAVPGGPVEGDLDAWRETHLAGTPDEVLDRLAAFAKHGVEEIILSPGAVPFANHDDEMLDLIAERVLPRLRDL